MPLSLRYALPFWGLTPGYRGPATRDGASASPTLINGLLFTTPLMSEVTCGGAKRNHTFVTGGDPRIATAIRKNTTSQKTITSERATSPRPDANQTRIKHASNTHQTRIRHASITIGPINKRYPAIFKIFEREINNEVRPEAFQG